MAEIYIGLDLGQSAGWAVMDSDYVLLDSGVWNNRKIKHKGQLWVTFHGQIIDLIRDWSPSVVCYENIRRHVGTAAAHQYGLLRSCVQVTELDNLQIVYRPIEVSSWKKVSVGRGNATKQEYIDWANDTYGLSLGMKQEDQAAAIGVVHACVSNEQD